MRRISLLWLLTCGPAFSGYAQVADPLIATVEMPSVNVMTLSQAIESAREKSVAALEAKAGFVSSYWAYRSYKASRLPSLNLYGNLASFDRSLRQLQNYETGELVYYRHTEKGK